MSRSPDWWVQSFACDGDVVLRYLFLTAIVVLAVAAWLAWGVLRRGLFERRVERARRQFGSRRDALRAMFFEAAAASGKPRGLAWKRCELQDKIVLARDRATGELVGLVGATISFEAVEGGGMEEVEAVGNLRAATAVFSFNSGEWTTQGRALFNLEPCDVLERYRESLDPLVP